MLEVSVQELIELCAVDNELYCRTFFPKTVKDVFAPFHHTAWDALESNNRQVNLLMFRGSSKTSTSRLFTSKQIAYNISRTISYISKSEAHAIRSTSWLKKQIEHNTLFRETFRLRPGSKWQDTEFEVIVGDENSIWVNAAGIFGSIRGVNRDDARPDLIVLDDVLDDENCLTTDSRSKLNTQVYGALLQSLAPRTEAEHAKIVALNTPQNKEDFSVMATKDPSWHSVVIGCFSRETADLPRQQQESVWPDRFPSEDLRKDKLSFISRNMLATWLREMECKLTSPEKSAFQISWLRKYGVLPEGATYVYAIDPTPPPSERAIAKGLVAGDFEAHVVWGAIGDKRFLAHYELSRGHEPTWTIAKFFEVQRTFRPIKTVVETVAYQQTLVWLLKKAMESARRWYFISEFKSQKSKYVRIVNAHNGMASAGRVYVREDQTEFLEQFAQYPDVEHDDLLDASSIALMELEVLVNPDSDQAQAQEEEQLTSYRPLRIGHAP